MAYVEASAERFRASLAGLVGVAEQRMMGGVCFLANGNMIGCADRLKAGDPRFMFRDGKVSETEARSLPGFSFVDEGRCDVIVVEVGQQYRCQRGSATGPSPAADPTTSAPCAICIRSGSNYRSWYSARSDISRASERGPH